VWSYTSTPPHVFTALCLIKDKNNFTLPIYPPSDNSRVHYSHPARANTCYPCVVSYWLTLFSETANESSRSALQFQPVSYTNPSFRQAECSARFHACSSTVKMEATCSSETLIVFQRTTRRYIPQNTSLYCGRVL
jgi:hypothetical protein